MDKELSILLYKTRENWLKRKLVKDEASIPSYTPPIPRYNAPERTKWSKVSVWAFLTQFNP